VSKSLQSADMQLDVTIQQIKGLVTSLQTPYYRSVVVHINYMTLSLLHNSHHRLSYSKFSPKLHAAQIISYEAHNIPLHITTISGLYNK